MHRDKFILYNVLVAWKKVKEKKTINVDLSVITEGNMTRENNWVSCKPYLNPAIQYIKYSSREGFLIMLFKSEKKKLLDMIVTTKYDFGFTESMTFHTK